MRRIIFKWNRGAMWDASTKTSELVMPTEDIAEAVLQHLQAEAKNEGNPFGELWVLSSWEVKDDPATT